MLRNRQSVLAVPAAAMLVASATFGSCSSADDSGSGQDGGGDGAGGDALIDNGTGDNPYAYDNGSGGGGGNGAGGGSLPDSSEPPCSLAVSGAATAARPCTTSLEYFTAGQRSAFTISVADPRPLQLISISLGRPGYPTTGTWASTDPGAAGGATVETVPTEAGTATWQCVADGTGDAGTGSYSVAITVGQGKPTSTGE